MDKSIIKFKGRATRHAALPFLISLRLRHYL
nr:MAG TPA: hypothetical protein [Caudoviricetes sp.]